jgi:hypothetical protein
MPNVDAIANIDAVADQQKFLSDPDSRIRIVLQIRIREDNKLRIRPDPNHTWSFLWPLTPSFCLFIAWFSLKTASGRDCE